MEKYFGIHNHTHYSNIRLLDSINKPKDLIDTAIKLGLSGIAITDHECLSAHMEVNQYAKKIKVGNNVWIGGNVIVLPGVTIGDNVVIGAGSVVNKDIPSNVVAVGNPCKVIKNI